MTNLILNCGCEVEARPNSMLDGEVEIEVVHECGLEELKIKYQMMVDALLLMTTDNHPRPYSCMDYAGKVPHELCGGEE